LKTRTTTTTTTTTTNKQTNKQTHTKQSCDLVTQLTKLPNFYRSLSSYKPVRTAPKPVDVGPVICLLNDFSPFHIKTKKVKKKKHPTTNK
jgi:hypothetical protein